MASLSTTRSDDVARSCCISDTLTKIFHNMPNDKLRQRRQPRPKAVAKYRDEQDSDSDNDDEAAPTTTAVVVQSSLSSSSSSDRDAKRLCIRKQKLQQEPLESYFLQPFVVRLIAEFLDPFEVQAWSCCCKATRDVCGTVSFQLKRIFSQFRILKRYADRVHEAAHYDWHEVINWMLRGLKELQTVYGPYEVHPIHASILGDIMFDSLAKPKGDWEGDEKYLSELGKLLGRCELIGDHFVFGEFGDYFDIDESSIPDFSGIVDKVPAEPARVLLEEGRLPFVYLFTRENESHTDQYGLRFPDGCEADDSGDIPVEVFCINFQDALHESDLDSEPLEWFLGWYTDVFNDSSECCEHYKSLAEAFCQCVPYRRGPCGDWTQLLRAAWLKAHQISPFDDSLQGRMQWDRVVQSVGSGWDSPGDASAAGDEASTAEPLNFVYSYAYERNKEAAESAARRDVRIYLRENHELAKVSDYE